MALYVTDANLKVWLGITDTNNDAQITAANAGAKAAIDLYCGRNFDVTTSEARYYFPLDLWHVRIDDAATVTAVATDVADDGTWSTVWASSDWYAAPVGGIGPNGKTGWPYTSIVACEARTFPHLIRPSVKVTGTFGWSAVPDDIALAARLYAAELFKLHSAPLGTVWTEGGVDPIIRQNRPLRDLLSPYKTSRSAGDSRFMVA